MNIAVFLNTILWISQSLVETAVETYVLLSNFTLLMKIEKNVMQVQKTSIEIIHHLNEILLSLMPLSSTTFPSVCSTFFLQTSLPVAAACSEMEFDPCRLEMLVHNTTFAFAWVFWPYISYKQF